MRPQKRAGSLSNPENVRWGRLPSTASLPLTGTIKKNNDFKRTDVPVQREVRITEIQFGNSLCFDNS